MDRVGRRAIARTLTRLTTLVSAVVLLLACADMSACRPHDCQSRRREKPVRASPVVGANSVSALHVQTILTPPKSRWPPCAPHRASCPPTSTNPAGGSLRAINEIRRARRMVFTSYRRTTQTSCALIPQQIAVTRRITFQGKAIGGITVRSDLAELNAHHGQYLGLAGVVLVTSMIAALLMSWRAQRVISAPIVRLAQLASKVAHDKDYSARAPVPARMDEIAVLAEAFNGMLSADTRGERRARGARPAAHGGARRRATSELEAFSYSVSHDLRAPLRQSPASPRCSSSRRRTARRAGAAVLAHDHRRRRARMGQLIDDLLAFSRIGRGSCRSARRPRTISSARRADEVRRWRPTARDRMDASVRCRTCRGDPALLRLVFINLLSNAVKYTRRGRTRASRSATPATASEVVIFVRDNGVGFDMQYARQAVRRLPAAAPTSEEFEGTGIGLANVRRIVQRHGGRAWAEGEVERRRDVLHFTACEGGIGVSEPITTLPLQEAIARYWGYTTFRPLQREAMDAVLAGRDSLRGAADRRRQVAVLPGARRSSSRAGAWSSRRSSR